MDRVHRRVTSKPVLGKAGSVGLALSLALSLFLSLSLSLSLYLSRRWQHYLLYQGRGLAEASLWGVHFIQQPQCDHWDTATHTQEYQWPAGRPPFCAPQGPRPSGSAEGNCVCCWFCYLVSQMVVFSFKTTQTWPGSFFLLPPSYWFL